MLSALIPTTKKVIWIVFLKSYQTKITLDFSNGLKLIENYVKKVIPKENSHFALDFIVLDHSKTFRLQDLGFEHFRLF